MRVFHDIGVQLLLAALLFVLFTMQSQAAEINDVQFEDQAVIDGVELKLNGLALLKWAMLFDVYAGGFYLPEKVSASEWKSDVPKKLELCYFRRIRASDFGDASDKLLRENLRPFAYQALSDRLQAFYAFFEDVAPGDRYSINYTPDRGTELRLNDRAIGRVPGHDFAVAYFGIWLGENPINKDFRDELLTVR